MADSQIAWDGSARAQYVKEAAARTFMLLGAPKLSELPELFFEPPPRSVFVAAADVGTIAKVELHAVGVYAGRPEGDGPKPEPREPRPVRLRVRKTAHPVALFLMSYDPVLWEISVDADAALVGVYLSSYYASLVRCSAILGMVQPVVNGPHVYSFEARELGDMSGEELIESLRHQTGLPLASFQGDYYGEEFNVPCYRDVSVVRAILAEHTRMRRWRSGRAPSPFHVIDEGFIVRVGTRDEPIELPDRGFKAVALCTATSRFYAITDHDLSAVAAHAPVEQIEPPSGDRFSWLGGITYDSTRRRLVISTFLHAGEHHIFDPVAMTWRTVSVDITGGGIHALAYAPTEDVIYAVVDTIIGPPVLVRFSPDLEPRDLVQTAEPLPWRKLMGGMTNIQMSAFADCLVFCEWPHLAQRRATFDADHRARIEKAFLLDLASGESRLLDLRRPDERQRDPIRAYVADESASDSATEPEHRFEGHVWASELKRYATQVVDQVIETGQPLMIRGDKGYASVVSYAVYEGQLGTLDEVTYPDWQERLQRAQREIAARSLVRGDQLARLLKRQIQLHGLFLTPQAASDLATMERFRSEPFLMTVRTGGFPMRAPYEEFHCTQAGFGYRAILKRAGKEIWVGYVRQLRDQS
jgi:hypothetical protein